MIGLKVYWPKRYATAWEAQTRTRWGGLWVGLRFPRFWKTSGLFFARLTDREGSPK